MPYDQKQLLDLLLEYRSDESRKARRNVSLIGFVILAVELLGRRLTDINVFGLGLGKASPFAVALLAFVLLVYWTVMFALTWLQDREIQRERAVLLEAQVAPLIKRLEFLEKDKAQRGGQMIYSDYGEVKGSVAAYRSQQERTKITTVLGRIIRGLEVVIPFALSAASFVVLAFWVFDALS